jgi:hypothetical protein
LALDHFRDRRFLLALLHREEHKPGRDELREWERRRPRDSAGELVASVLELFLCGVGTPEGQRAWRSEP